jgi:hypothetical protein
MVALVAVPEPSLGAQAAAMKRPSNEVLLSQISDSGGHGGGQGAAASSTADATFVEVAVATLSPGEGADMGLRPGDPVRVHGIVVHDTGIPGTYGLARFFISCCAGDALPVLVPVHSPAGAKRPEQDRWVLVSGTLTRRGSSLIVVPASVRETGEPENAYLTASDGGAPPSDGSLAAPAPRKPAVIFVPAPPADPAQPAAPEVSAAAAGHKGTAARVFDDFYFHCRRYTYQALVYPERVASADAAVRLFVGQPKNYREAAQDGCLAGLNAGEATITVQSRIEETLSESHDDSRRVVRDP